MRLSILAVGKMKAGPEHDLYNRFEDRIVKSGRSLHFAPFSVTEISESRQANAPARKAEEADVLLGKCPPGSRIILLDERGKDVTSQQFANLLLQEQESGTEALCFAIGGPDGHGEAIENVAVRKIRLGAMTWPHQIARILLVEQIYRAITILSGHPYHRE